MYSPDNLTFKFFKMTSFDKRTPAEAIATKPWRFPKHPCAFRDNLLKSTAGYNAAFYGLYSIGIIYYPPDL